MSGILDCAAADDARLGRSFGAPLIALLFGTGLGLGEALAVPWGAEGLDLDAGLVRVRRSLDRVRDKETDTFAFVAPKTRTSRREVPVRPSDLSMLSAADLIRHRARYGRSGSPISARVWRRRRASAGDEAWWVASDPSCPVVIAVNMSPSDAIGPPLAAL